MSVELPHLQGASKATALQEDSERIAWIRQERWIQYARAERVLHGLADLIDDPPRDRMPCLVIYGITGMGKTRIVQKFLRDHRSRFDPSRGKTRLPVVSIQMPPAPTPQDLYEEILIGMGGLFAQRTTASTWRHRIPILAHQLEVRMLVIDEIHAILAGTFRAQRIIWDAIRLLANDLRVPLVCAGNPRGESSMDDRSATRRPLGSHGAASLGKRSGVSSAPREL